MTFDRCCRDPSLCLLTFQQNERNQSKPPGVTAHPHKTSIPALMVLHHFRSESPKLSRSTRVKNLFSRYSKQAGSGAPQSDSPSSVAPLALRPDLRMSASQDSLVPDSSQSTSKPAVSGLGLSPTAGPLDSLDPCITVTPPMKDQRSAPHNRAAHQVGKTEDRSPAGADSGLGLVSSVHCCGAMMAL